MDANQKKLFDEILKSKKFKELVTGLVAEKTADEFLEYTGDIKNDVWEMLEETYKKKANKYINEFLEQQNIKSLVRSILSGMTKREIIELLQGGVSGHLNTR